jgi:hypothetical protein
LPEPKSNVCSVWKASFMIRLSKAKGHGCRKSAVNRENPLSAARAFVRRHSRNVHRRSGNCSAALRRMATVNGADDEAGAAPRHLVAAKQSLAPGSRAARRRCLH